MYFLLNLPCDGDPVALAREAIAGGVTTIQLRGKQTPGGTLFAVAEALLPVVREGGAGLIINDRLDVALAVGADGVHVGRDDLPVDVVRRVAPDLCIGASCYGSVARAQAMAAQGADYLAFGAFFASPTKPQAPQISLDVLTQARGLDRPLVAIGGITPAHVAALSQAGAHGMAVISAIQQDPDPRAAAAAFRTALTSARQP